MTVSHTPDDERIRTTAEHLTVQSVRKQLLASGDFDHLRQEWAAYHTVKSLLGEEDLKDWDAAHGIVKAARNDLDEPTTSLKTAEKLFPDTEAGELRTIAQNINRFRGRSEDQIKLQMYRITRSLLPPDTQKHFDDIARAEGLAVLLPSTALEQPTAPPHTSPTRTR